MANTEDLRYVRTEAALRAAFMELVAETPVSSVTASAICRRAGISRNAFYLHHTGVDGLYAALVCEMVDDVRAECLSSSARVISSGSADEGFELAVLGALASHEGLLRALLPADDGTLAKRLAEGLEESFVEAALSFGSHGASAEHRLRCAYSAWAIVGLMSRWIAQTDRPLGEVAGLFHEMHDSVTKNSSRYLLGKGSR